MKRIATLFAAAMIAAPHPVPAGPGHDHGHAAAEHDLSKAQRLPAVAIGGWAVTPLLHGVPVPGREADITLLFEGPGFPRAVRAWVGNESADQTGKTRLDKSGDHAAHGHLPMPEELGASDALWIELEDARGKQRRSVALPEAVTGHGHGDVLGHEAETLSARVSAAADGRFVLTLEGADGKPLSAADISPSHGAPVHLVLVDGALEDFHHLHPVESAPGQWSLSFTPRNPGPYRVYAEAKPLAAKASAVAITAIPRAGAPKVSAAPAPATATVDGVTYALAWSSAPVAGHDSRFEVLVTASEAPRVEPLLGAAAHVFVLPHAGDGFAHAHAVPRAEGNGTVISGEVPPLAEGAYRMFVHAKVNGREVIVPFDVTVAAHDHLH
jgi:hypothetical protein